MTENVMKRKEKSTTRISNTHIMYLHSQYSLQPLKPMMFFLLFFLLSSSTATITISSDRAALLSLRSAVGGRTLLWNTSHPTPCAWTGVECENNRVTAVHLPASSLSGDIPPNTLSNLTSLRTLSLRFNRLAGPFPSDLSHLSQLRNLYLQDNSFSGALPSFLFSLRSLTRLNIANNNFSGEIVSSFNNLTRLRTLYLENNQFYGPIPELKLRNLEQFNVSFNSLNGSIPKSLQEMPENAFIGNALCGKPLLSACSEHGKKIIPPTIVGVDLPPTVGSDKEKNGLSGAVIAGIVMGSVVVLMLILLVLFVLFRKRGGNKGSAVDVAATKEHEMNVSGENEGGGDGIWGVDENGNEKGESGGNVNRDGAKKLVFLGEVGNGFDLEDLLRASAEVLGKGTFATTYKATLDMGSVVAVKRLKEVTISENEFREKIEGVGAMNHENLVPLKAYYYSKEEKLLVYDYLPMGSLSALVHGNKGAGRTPLNWKIRSSIALGAARGIEYLHSQGANVSHGNIRSSNILLTKSYEARVSDFGLAQLVAAPSSPTRVAGYRAPEVTEPRRVSQKADVYSFGVLLLELLTGKAPIHALLNEEGVDLPRWVQSVMREEWTSEVFDLELLRYQSVEEETVQLLQLALDCTAQYPDNRPSISQVARRIEELHRSRLRDDQQQPDQVTETD